MRTSALRYGFLLALGAWVWACTENDGALVLPEVASDGGDATAPAPDAGADADATAVVADASDEDALAPLPKCSDGGFCRTELPTSEILYSLWGAADGSLWAGSSRSILQWDGVAWKTVFTWPAGEAPGIRAGILVGTGPEDVWAFGEGPEYAEAGGIPRAAVAHLARRGAVLSWRAITSDVEFYTGGNVSTAWAASPTDLWVSRNYQGLWHVHGENANGHAPAERELNAFGQPLLAESPSVWGFGLDRVFVSGRTSNDMPVLLRRTLDGGWKDTLQGPPPGGQPFTLGGTGPAEARLWTSADTTMARAVAADGGLLAPDFQRTSIDVPRCQPRLVAAVRSDLAWTSDGNTVCRYDGSSFKLVPISLGGYPRLTVRGLWSNGTDTWIVGEEKALVPGGLPRGFALRHGGGT